MFLSLLAGAQAAQDIGFEGPAFSPPTSSPSESKPESKLWFNDGIWWGSLWSLSAAAFRIHRLDFASHAWIDTGVASDARSNSRSDALWDGTKLYIASHRFASSGGANGYPVLLYRYSYDDPTDTYGLDAGFPVTIGNSSTEALTIDEDSTDTLWAAWTQGLRVRISHSMGSDTRWSSPVVLPANTSDIKSDDLCGLIHFHGDRIGVLWSDQNVNTFFFSVHRDGDPDTVWSAPERATNGESDDHLNLAAHSDGRVFVAVKNANNNLLLLVRSLDGTWSRHVVSAPSPILTRPVVLLDEPAGIVRVFATGQTTGPVFEKTSPIDSISFATGLGTIRMRDASNVYRISNPTSTKQNVDSSMGLVVLAHHDTTGLYWHHEVAPSASVVPVAGFTALPTGGPAPLDVAFTDGSTGSIASRWWDFGDGGTSTAISPRHTYTAAGSYTVSLTVTGSGGSDTEIKVGLIGVTAPQPSRTLLPVADARVSEGSRFANYGASSDLRVRSALGSSVHTYLRFDLTGVGALATAKLRLFCTDGSPVGGLVFPTSSGWSETGITWTNRPAASGIQIASLGTVATNTWVELDVRAAVGSGGLVSFLLTSTSSNSALYSSREGTRPPELIVTTTFP